MLGEHADSNHPLPAVDLSARASCRRSGSFLAPASGRFLHCFVLDSFVDGQFTSASFVSSILGLDLCGSLQVLSEGYTGRHRIRDRVKESKPREKLLTCT